MATLYYADGSKENTGRDLHVILQDLDRQKTEADKKAKAEGNNLTGYETIRIDGWKRSLNQEKTFQMPIYQAASPAPAPPTPAPTPEPEPAPEPVKEEPLGPVEYSPEIQKAKEKVQQYESNIESGKTSESVYDNLSQPEYDFSQRVFGDSSQRVYGYSPRDTQTTENTYDDPSERIYTKPSSLDFSNNFDFSSKTFGGQSSKAAASFLDNKKQSVKNSFFNMGN